MIFDAGELPGALRYDPVKALVAPRPIGWISTCNVNGDVNLAPYSFFNLLSDTPHIVGFSSEGRKDSLTFAEETGEFVCNIVPSALRERMNLCSAALPRGQNEFEFAGLDAEPSLKVTPPRVAGIPAALECTWLRTVPMVASSGEARYFLVLGEVVAMYVDDRYVREGRVDTAAMEIVMRGGYRDYFSAREEARFQMTRPHAPCR